MGILRKFVRQVKEKEARKSIRDYNRCSSEFIDYLKRLIKPVQAKLIPAETESGQSPSKISTMATCDEEPRTQMENLGQFYDQFTTDEFNFDIENCMLFKDMPFGSFDENIWE